MEREKEKEREKRKEKSRVFPNVISMSFETFNLTLNSYHVLCVVSATLCDVLFFT